MGRKERRAKERNLKIENLHKPVKANQTVLIVIAIFTIAIVVATYYVRYYGQ